MNTSIPFTPEDIDSIKEAMNKPFTPEEQAIFDEMDEEALRIAKCTDPADRITAEEAIQALYAKENLPAPEFVWVRSPVEAREVVENLGGEWFQTDLWGQHDVYEIQNARFAIRIGVQLSEEAKEEAEIWFKIAKSMMWWWPYDTHCICCDRPEQLHLDDTDELHNENGPAFRFRDGTEIYAIHGVTLSKEEIESVRVTKTIKLPKSHSTPNP